jgi:hypothetical protein
MADQNDAEDHLSPQELRRWLGEELRDLAKAFQLRASEATSFVTAYALGEISPAEAAERLELYDKRWGEALPGTIASPDKTDEQIIAAIDRTREQQFRQKLASGRLGESRTTSL